MFLDSVFEIPCKIIAMASGSDFPKHMDKVSAHFESENAAPIMIGGSNGGAMTVVGIKDDKLIMIDPHFVNVEKDEWEVPWFDCADLFNAEDFYNLCLPMTGEWCQ
eukprot:TRINITY_DN9560_c0_g1_i1.p2 TRINITY_DN9560_c0_g1~~TRINITY_DN9560_c0_g1_i1.p2  ORF type:complete len:106 (-),score=27.08 TRINITY_DN9560_c0_g1_i1:40-357(-)